MKLGPSLITLLAASLSSFGAVTIAASDVPAVDVATLELCIETQHELDGVRAELETSQVRLDARRADIDEGEARLLEIKAVIEDEDAEIDLGVRSALISEFNVINANRTAQVPAFQDDRDYVGSLIDRYNALTDAYNAQCGDITYIAEQLAEICERRPEFGGTRWCSRVE